MSGLMVLVGCTTSPRDSTTEEEKHEEKKCVETREPFDKGTGHYAGYESAENKGSRGLCCPLCIVQRRL